MLMYGLFFVCNKPILYIGQLAKIECLIIKKCIVQI